MASPFYTAEHEAYREVVRRFVEREIEPYAHEWDEAGRFPRVLYEKAAAIGLLGLGFPEEYGGTEVDNFMWIVAVQELARAGAGGVSASLKSNSIGAPPIARAGSPEFKARVLPEILSGKKISALAITEPSGGSDVANLRTSARRDGDCYVVNGEKTFITSGMRADYITTAVRTGGSGPGGVSLLVRHKLVDMAQRVAVSQAMLEMLAWRLDHGESPVAEICMLKNQATQTMAFCASEAVQIFGGAGYMRGIKVERIYRDVKVNAIGGGSEEIMKDLASRQMGL
jgi:alkylation response protein AidB-like acyl-CoA dehydrogenase